jgi:uncharacterized protein YjbI with pentapeptide repeats
MSQLPAKISIECCFNIRLDSNQRSMNQQRPHSHSQLLSTFVVSLLVGLCAWCAIASPVLATDYNNATLIGENFSHRDLTDSSFAHANLRGSDFSHSNLEEVSFFSSNLSRANFEGANLRNATLGSTRLTRANFTNAVLEGAFAMNAMFDGATIDGADFTDVLMRQDEIDKLCQVASGTNPTTGRETRETLFCP